MALAIATGYLLGSIPFAFIVARRSNGVDLRRAGSGNLGAANVARVAGVAAGLLVATLDIGKGIASVLLAGGLAHDPAAAAAAGLAAVVGHVYPVWLRFHGGKGAATGCGVFTVLAPLAIAPALVVFFVTVWLTRYVSLACLTATAVVPPLAWATGSPAPAVRAAFAAAALIVFRHRSNLARLWTGTEPRFGVRA
jgi:acyl phosphate:glycerol-3-phosphate acyltransferase